MQARGHGFRYGDQHSVWIHFQFQSGLTRPQVLQLYNQTFPNRPTDQMGIDNKARDRGKTKFNPERSMWYHHWVRISENQNLLPAGSAANLPQCVTPNDFPAPAPAPAPAAVQHQSRPVVKQPAQGLDPAGDVDRDHEEDTSSSSSSDDAEAIGSSRSSPRGILRNVPNQYEPRRFLHPSSMQGMLVRALPDWTTTTTAAAAGIQPMVVPSRKPSAIFSNGVHLGCSVRFRHVDDVRTADTFFLTDDQWYEFLREKVRHDAEKDRLEDETARGGHS
ncbi:hypothetical protein MKZ38_008875 [Zalerion maritima]|uniref:Uncharacterized protein n=1 Tax=Zalerion maritima TaxID=339359 RepID=A0AAD5WT76_9PEZI|nr:hypothetical protein MKZ38_008875 [Zalerion maritima]